MSFYFNQIAKGFTSSHAKSLKANALLNKVEQLKTGTNLSKVGKTQTSHKTKSLVSEANSLKRDREIHQVAAKFESIFLKELLKIMRKTVPKSGFLNGGWTEEFYWDMLNSELSECMANAGGIGLAKMVYQHLS